MSNEEEMEYQSSSSELTNARRSESSNTLPSRSTDALTSSSRRRSTSRRRGHYSNLSRARNLNRSSSRVTSTPDSTHGGDHVSTQLSTINLSSMVINERNGHNAAPLPSPIPASNPPVRSQSTVRSLPFDLSFDDEQNPRSNTGQRTRSGKMKNTDVFSHFTLRPDGRYDCNTCQQPYMAYNDSATNLRRHLFSKHDIVGAAYNSQLAQIKKQTAQSNEPLPILPKARRKQLDQAVLDCIIDDSLPFTTFSKPGMTNLIKTFDSRYKPPSRFTIASRVDDVYRNYIEQVKVILKQRPAVAFTADIWKSGQRRYFISLTAHVFDDDFQAIPLVLSLRQLIERHLAKNVQSFINFELNEKFEIQPRQRVGITTDCGGEMVAATSTGLFGPRHSCIGHVWNNVVKNGLCLWIRPNPEKFPVDEIDIGNESIRSVTGDEDDLMDDEDRGTDQSDDENDDDVKVENDLNVQQLNNTQLTTFTAAVKKKIPGPTEDEFLSDEDQPVMIQPETRAITLIGILERVFNLLNKCRQLVCDVRNIGIVNAYVSTEIGKRGRGVTVDMEIRWNTTFQMLDRLLEHQVLIDTVVRRKFDGLTVVQANRLKLAALTPDDWDVLRALHHVLMGFDVATTIISSSHYPTLADSFWAISKLRQILISTTDDSRYIELLKMTALNYLNTYIEKHLSKEQQQGMLIAAFLDPETHNDMGTSDYTKAMAIVKGIVDQMPTIVSTTTYSSLSGRTSSAIAPKKDSAKQLMNQLAKASVNQASAVPMNADVEIALFTNAMKTNQTFQQFWCSHRHSFPRLVALVHRYCLVPATSVSSESAFSIAGFITRKQRSSLSSRTLRHLLVLKYRKNLVKLQPKEQVRSAETRGYQSLSVDPIGSSVV